jgi:glycosyltransferase involved in cell wall biosynthesis
MHIVQFHHVRLPVPKYGGAERIVVWLSQGLVELGHQVTLLAPKGSRVEGGGVRVVEVAPQDVLSPGFDLRRYVSEPVDLMHYHCPVQHPPGIAYVWTLHGNMGPGQRADGRTICVSQDHARRHQTPSFVHNGVRLDEYEFRATKGDYDLFLARLHGVKGWRLAIAAAKQCRVRLVLAGGWRPSVSRFVKFVGEVGGARKRELLAGARCLWMPVQWDDPCPVNILEALASGTPVIASPRGSLPELISPDTGGLGGSLEELVALRGRLAEWDPRACRARAERYFTHTVMAGQYLRMYRHLLETGTLPAGRVMPPSLPPLAPTGTPR